MAPFHWERGRTKKKKLTNKWHFKLNRVIKCLFTVNGYHQEISFESLTRSLVTSTGNTRLIYLFILYINSIDYWLLRGKEVLLFHWMWREREFRKIWYKQVTQFYHHGFRISLSHKKIFSCFYSSYKLNHKAKCTNFWLTGQR